MKTTRTLYRCNRNNSLTTKETYTTGRTEVTYREVMTSMFEKGLIECDLSRLTGKKARAKIYSHSKTAKFQSHKSEMEIGLTSSIEKNVRVGDFIFEHDGRSDKSLIDMCINSAIVGIPQLNPETNKRVIIDFYQI